MIFFSISEIAKIWHYSPQAKINMSKTRKIYPSLSNMSLECGGLHSKLYLPMKKFGQPGTECYVPISSAPSF